MSKCCLSAVNDMISKNPHRYYLNSTQTQLTLPKLKKLMMEIDRPEIEAPDADNEINATGRADGLIDVDDPLRVELENAELESQIHSVHSLSLFQAILDNQRSDEEAQKLKEQALFGICRLRCSARNFDEVLNLVRSNAAFFNSIPKARTAKIVREIIDVVAKVDNTQDVQVSLCRNVIEWCRLEKRTFLRQRIEARLSSLLLNTGNAQESLSIVTRLLRELKKLDDKQLLLEVHWIESKAQQALLNLSKARSALTASRATANSVYVSPVMLAELDLMSGILHCEEGDFTTSYSYLFEAFEAFHTAKLSPSCVRCLSYMILVKVLGKHAEDVAAVVSSRSATDYKSHVLVSAMIEISDASKHRSLQEFDSAMLKSRHVFSTDPLIGHNLDRLHNDMLESNVLKIIKPYSRIETHCILSKLTGHEMSALEFDRKLSQMILDEKIHGTLDQANGHLVIYEDEDESKLESSRYASAVLLLSGLDNAVTSLFQRSNAISSAAP